MKLIFIRHMQTRTRTRARMHAHTHICWRAGIYEFAILCKETMLKLKLQQVP
jgi:hypothetical protein